jgi:hypothetical protein
MWQLVIHWRAKSGLADGFAQYLRLPSLLGSIILDLDAFGYTIQRAI